MTAKKRKWWKVAVVILIAVILVVFFRDSFAEGLREILKVPAKTVVFLLCLSMGYFLAEGGVITILARSYTNTVSYRNGVACALYCSFFRLITFGSGSGIAEVYYLNRQGMKAAEATGMSLVQYLIQKITICLMGAVSFFFCFRYVSQYIGDYQGYIALAVLITMVIGAGILMITVFEKGKDLLFHYLSKATAGKESWNDKVKKAEGQADILQDGAKKLYHKKHCLALAFVLNLAKYFCWFLTPYVLYGDEERLTLLVSLVLMALATMVAGVIPTPSGYGSLDAMIILLFYPLLGEAKAVSLVILYRVVVSLFPFLMGMLVAARPLREQRELEAGRKN